MTNKRMRLGFLSMVLAIVSMTCLGGCVSADPAALQTFVADLLRNAATALLL